MVDQQELPKLSVQIRAPRVDLSRWGLGVPDHLRALVGAALRNSLHGPRVTVSTNQDPKN